MSKSIWKFPLEVTDAQTLKMPTGAEVLTVQSQNELPFLWALVDTEALTAFYEVRVFGTGHVIPSDLDLTYLGTYITKRSELVFHYFLLKPASTL